MARLVLKLFSGTQQFDGVPILSQAFAELSQPFVDLSKDVGMVLQRLVKRGIASSEIQDLICCFPPGQTVYSRAYDEGSICLIREALYNSNREALYNSNPRYSQCVLDGLP